MPFGQHHGIDRDVAHIQAALQQGHQFTGLHPGAGHDVKEASDANTVPNQSEHDGRVVGQALAFDGPGRKGVLPLPLVHAGGFAVANQVVVRQLVGCLGRAVPGQIGGAGIQGAAGVAGNVVSMVTVNAGLVMPLAGVVVIWCAPSVKTGEVIRF